MNSQLFLSIARRLMRVPAVAFHEHAIRSVVCEICDEHKLKWKCDAFGNLLVEQRRGRGERPVVLVAHLDHPGFEIVRAIDKKTFHARFLGGVPETYFRNGTKLRMMPSGESARLGGALAGDKEYTIRCSTTPKEVPEYCVWELEDFAHRDGKVVGRACDDLIGVASILTTLIELKRSRRPGWVIGAITRAEEIGFGGSLSLASADSLPDDSMIISLETSKEIPGVVMGEGVVVRVGDRSSVFDSDATRFLYEKALVLQKEKKRFEVQRALMGGGSCEGTVFHEAGYQTAALCVALGNYHNCGPNTRISEEFVSRADAISMVELLLNLAVGLRGFDKVTGKLSNRLAKIRRQTEARLRKTA